MVPHNIFSTTLPSSELPHKGFPSSTKRRTHPYANVLERGLHHTHTHTVHWWYWQVGPAAVLHVLSYSWTPDVCVDTWRRLELIVSWRFGIWEHWKSWAVSRWKLEPVTWRSVSAVYWPVPLTELLRLVCVHWHLFATWQQIWHNLTT